MFRISTLLITKVHKYNDLNFWNKLNNFSRNLKVSCTRTYYPTNLLQKRVWSNESKNRLSSLEILEDTYKRQGRIYSHNIESVLKQSDEEWGTSNCGLLLLQCCGTLLVDQNPQSRQALCEKVWKKLSELNSLSVLHYNAYIQICIQNNVYLNHKEFLQKMICEANEDTYKLLMRCASEFGDTQNALGVLYLMKEKRYVADEHVFMSLVLGHAIQGGLKEVLPVLKTMQTAHVPVSPQIINSIIRGLVLHDNKEEFLEAFRQFSVQLSEADLIQLMMVLGQTDHHSWLDNVIQLIDPIQISKQNVEEFNLMCSRLIHMGKTEAAMLYYKKFAEPSGSSGDDNYAFFLLVDMLSSHTPISKIIEIINELKRDGLNLVALEN
ncbi:hypothetical protein FQR65_LT09775 [Abscondita terminalis]|nr:hypothetical protein FQR65_LT09775 [Abscondita terminalis]